jgi:hypothetical protein
MNTKQNTSRGHHHGRNSHRNINLNSLAVDLLHSSKRTTRGNIAHTPIVSFADAWDSAIAKKGLENVHFPTTSEVVANHVAAVKEVQQQRHSQALNLIGE